MKITINSREYTLAFGFDFLDYLNKNNSMMVEVDGKNGRVCELNVLSGNYKVKVSDNEEIIVSVDIDGNN